ncbi:MAG: YkgJ family cysteine cluster protein [Promethearchaeota archaeon]|jgi:Fe-S-cluster containining protein
MINPKELRFICTRCGNCCTDKDTLVNVTYLDILRMKTALKLDLKEVLNIIGFYVFDKKLTNKALEKMVISPIETERGLAFPALLKNKLGECYFYDKKKMKCLIYDIRPKLCRTFPFSFNSMGNKVKENIRIIYTDKAKSYCPGINSDSPIIEHDFWIQIGFETLKEIEKNSQYNEKWNKRIKSGKISPNVKNYIQTILNMDEKEVLT